MGGVFVNYRTGDGEAIAHLIEKALSTRFGKENVFLAGRSIPPGGDFPEHIARALRDSDVLLAIIGRQWLIMTDRQGRRRIDSPDDWVSWEIAQALNHQPRTRVIPILVDNARPLVETDLPGSISALARKEYRRLDHRYADRDIADLVDRLAELLPAPACPYRGLEPFGVEHTEFFRGRTAEVETLVERLKHEPVVIVVGASGSGKSSLIHAGLIPRLQATNATWAVCYPVPGRTPRELLSKALGSRLGPDWDQLLTHGDLSWLANSVVESTGELVICVDQFEELITTDPPAATELFNLVLTLVHGQSAAPGRRHPLRAVFTIRSSADLDQVRTPERSRLLREAAVFMYPLSGAELESAIIEPAALANRPFEPGLVNRILHDAKDAPGQMPLIEFALTRLWESESPGVLTHNAYEKLGGVTGALTRYADKIFEEQQRAGHGELVRRLLVQLVRPGEDGSFTASPVRLEQLDPSLRGMAWELSKHRLVMIRSGASQPEVVTLAHEALVRGWDRLRGWLDAAHQFRLWQEQLRVTLTQYLQSNKDPGALLRGAPLTTAEEWLGKDPDGLTDAERDYIVTSSGASVREQTAARRSARRLRRLVVGLAIALAVALVAVVVAAYSARTAVRLRNIAISRVVAGDALALRTTNPALAAQLSLAAYRLNPTVEARGALLSAFAVPYAIRLTDHTDNVESVAFGARTGILATAGRDRSVRLWDIADKYHPADLQVLSEHTDVVWSVALRQEPANPQLLATASADRTAQLWDITNPRHPIKLAILSGHTNAVRSVAFGPITSGPHLLATASHDSTVRLWDITNPTRPSNVATLTGHQGGVISVAFSPDGRTLATGGADRTIRVWDVTNPESPRFLTTLTGHGSDVFSVAFSPDGRMLASGSADSTARIWDVAAGNQPQELATLSGANLIVSSVAFSPDGKTLATASHDNTMRLWDITDPRQPVGIAVNSGHTAAVTSAMFSPDGSTVATASADHTVRLWEMPVPALRAHTNAVLSVAASPDGRTLVTASADHTARLWDITDVRHPTSVATLTGHAHNVYAAAFSPDGRVLATASYDRSVQLWDVTDPRMPTRLGTLTGEHSDGITSVAFTPDGKTLATGSFDNTVRLWDISNPRQPVSLSLIMGHADVITRLAISPTRSGGYILATASRDDTARLWDISDPRNPRNLAVLTGHVNDVTAIAFDHGGRILATGSQDNTVRLWDVSDPGHPTNLTTMTVDPTGIVSMAFSRDGHLLATGSLDSGLRLWDISDVHRPSDMASLFGHSNSIESMVLLPDGHTLVTGSGDHTVRFWEIDAERVARRVCDVAYPPISRSDWEAYFPGLPYQPPC